MPAMPKMPDRLTGQDTDKIIPARQSHKKLKRGLLIGSASLVALFVIIPFTVVLIVLAVIFSGRHETDPALALSLADYPGLVMEEETFLSASGEQLQGYFYQPASLPSSGLIIMAHGFGGGGHNSYMEEAWWFSQAGYYVFAYDATANDKSTGSGIGGFEQGILDLDRAIATAESHPEVDGLKVCLFGHSWGAYSASCVLTMHPEVSAVCAVSGMNSGIGLIEQEGVSHGGPAASLLMPWFRAVLSARFPGLTGLTSLYAYEESDAGVLIIHGENDTTILPGWGYDIYASSLRDDDRFTFLLIPDRGHDDILRSDEAIAGITAFNEEYTSAYLAAYPQEDATDEQLAAFREEYLKNNLSRSLWAYKDDPALMQSIIAFFDAA